MLFAQNAMAERMLILKGIQNKLDVESAKTYAEKLGYEPYVLNESGENGVGNPQARAAIKAINSDSTITAIYGFSGGGYNTRRIYSSLSAEKRKQIKRIDILGSPGVTRNNFNGVSIVNIIPNSPRSHMDTPRWWLEKNFGRAKAN